MLKIKSYVKVNSLEEAYELNQKKTARIIGGMVWMKMGNRAISTAIDLSGLGLDAISENDDEFVIGCMTPLHDLETNEALNTYTHGAMKESLCHIVGVQFRNCATVGGSIYGRYGFSDVLTMFLGMDTWVELYDAGRIPLTEFVNMKKDNDILVNIIVRKEPLLTCYLSQRNIKTDFPVLTCAASVIGNEARTCNDFLSLNAGCKCTAPTPGWKILKQVLPRRWPELHVSLPIKMCLRNVLPLPARLHRR